MKYGLSSAIYTQDIKPIALRNPQLYTGICYVNSATIGAEVPSAVRRNEGDRQRPSRGRGTAALDVFSEWKSVYVDFSGKLQRAQIDTEVFVGRVLRGCASAPGPEGPSLLIALPPHQGPVTLTFDLHNRHTYSEEQVKANRASARYTAVIGALTLDNTLISRAAVQSEFRKASDLVERIGGGAGPGGVKAVAPTGTEPSRSRFPRRKTRSVCSARS